MKRLKSLEEPTNKQIADKDKLDKIINELYLSSKTYEHNKKILSTQLSKPKKSIIEILFDYIKNVIKFCFKCIAYFVLGYIILIIILLLLKYF